MLKLAPMIEALLVVSFFAGVGPVYAGSQPLQCPQVRGVQPAGGMSPCGGGGGGGEGAGGSPYSMSANPSALSFVAGSSSNTVSRITFTSNNCYGSVLTLSSTRPTVQDFLVSIDAAVSLPACGTTTATLSIATSIETPSGSYYVMVNSQDNSGTRTLTVPVTVTADFTISASPNALYLGTGFTGTSQVTISSRGFSGTVTLDPPSVEPLVIGINPSYSGPTSLSLSPGTSASTSLTVAVQSVPSGGYSLRLNGRDSTSSIFHSILLGLNVCANSQRGPEAITWAGYEFKGACSDRTVPITYASAILFVAKASEPSYLACDNTFGSKCIVNAWVGLENQLGGTGGIVQAGTESTVSCGYGSCSSTYRAWYELFPGDPVYTDSLGCQMYLSEADQVFVEIINHLHYGANSDQTLYDITIRDDTSHTSCNQANLSFAQFHQPDMGTPYYADYITEVRADAGVRLPKFATFLFQNCFLEIGTPSVESACWTLYTRGWWRIDIMHWGSPSDDPNITTSPYGNTALSVVWNNSAGT